MAKVIVGMTMSLDGFINDSSGSVAVLYSDFETLQNSVPMREAIQNTGAVVMGWNAFCMAEDPDLYADHYEFQVPIFVLAHEAPQKRPKESTSLTFTFVSDGVESAIHQAKTAAGDKEVTVIGGASTVQRCLKAGLADELHVDIMPVLLGDGLRMFEEMGTEQMQLERLQVNDIPGGRTHLRFRVLK